jgi:serine kinase of HPr protein (carbohydrate metabolism regulator)
MHASALVIGDRGLLIAGPAGSGKTALCLALLRQCQRTGIFARLVCDDQTFLERAGARLIARAPDTIASLIEVQGFRPSEIAHEPAMVVDLLVRLVPAEDAPRYSEGQTETLEQCPIASLHLPAGNAAAGLSAILAWFVLQPFRAA